MNAPIIRWIPISLCSLALAAAAFAGNGPGNGSGNNAANCGANCPAAANGGTCLTPEQRAQRQESRQAQCTQSNGQPKGNGYGYAHGRNGQGQRGQRGAGGGQGARAGGNR